MRRSPMRPLILRRRKLPFDQNGGALTTKGKGRSVQGPNKFILRSENGTRDNGSFCQPAVEGDGVGQAVKGGTQEAKPAAGNKTLNKDPDSGPLDDSLTNIEWLGKMSTCALDPNPAKETCNKENQNLKSQPFRGQNIHIDAPAVQQPISERPPYSYMAMIQFAINSRRSRRMTLKDIYTWIEEHFPYFRKVAKPGWKNSIRHNLSLHDMFTRETSPDGKISFWTIRPEANRCLTLDQVYKQQKKTPPIKIASVSERRMKVLLPRTESYFVPIQLPVASPVYLSPSSVQFTPSSQQSASRGIKRVWIAPKVTQSDVPAVVMYPKQMKDLQGKVKDEPPCVRVKRETPKSGSSRRKQRLVCRQEEPALLCPDGASFDLGAVADASTSRDVREVEPHEENNSGFSFKTPVKSSSHLTSTPSKHHSHVLTEPWKVTPVGKGGQSVPWFSPFGTPGGPAVRPQHFSRTPSKEWALFSSPRELLIFAPSRATRVAVSPVERFRSSCSRELLQATGAAAANSSTEDIVLDSTNDSLSKMLMDISFCGLDDEDLGPTNISWSEIITQFK